MLCHSALPMQRFTIFVAALRQQKSPDFYPGQSAGSLPEEARKLHRMCQFDFSNISSCRAKIDFRQEQTCVVWKPVFRLDMAALISWLRIFRLNHWKSSILDRERNIIIIFDMTVIWF
jgi:hypothetical protein